MFQPEPAPVLKCQIQWLINIIAVYSFPVGKQCRNFNSDYFILIGGRNPMTLNQLTLVPLFFLFRPVSIKNHTPQTFRQLLRIDGTLSCQFHELLILKIKALSVPDINLLRISGFRQFLLHFTGNPLDSFQGFRLLPRQFFHLTSFDNTPPRLLPLPHNIRLRRESAPALSDFHLPVPRCGFPPVACPLGISH